MEGRSIMLAMHGKWSWVDGLAGWLAEMNKGV